MSEKKYANEIARAQIESFLEETLDNLDIDVDLEVLDAPADRHTDFETPELVVNFTGPDVDMLMENKQAARLALARARLKRGLTPVTETPVVAGAATEAWSVARVCSVSSDVPQ